MSLQKRVLEFWFEDLLTKPNAVSAVVKKWFSFNPEIDEEIRSLFLKDYEKHVNLELKADESTLIGDLVLLDQFPRNMFRNSERAFEADKKALKLAMDGLSFYESIPLNQRFFIHLVFMHAENIEMQHKSVELTQKWIKDCESFPELHKFSLNTLNFAKEHLDIIKLYNRFPHRNRVLKRQNTEQEEKFLQNGPNYGQK